MRDAFFSRKFSKIHNEHAIFRQFSDVKTWERSQQRSVLSDGYRWIPTHQN